MQGGIVDGEEDEEDYVPVQTSPHVTPFDGGGEVEPPTESSVGKTPSPRPGSKRSSPRDRASKRTSRGFGAVAKHHQRSGFDDDSDEEAPQNTSFPHGGSLLMGAQSQACAQEEGRPEGALASEQHPERIPVADTQHVDPRDKIIVEKETLFSDSLKLLLQTPPRSVALDWRQLPKRTVATNFPSYRELQAEQTGQSGSARLNEHSLASLGSNSLSPNVAPGTPRSDSNAQTPRSSLASGLTPRLHPGRSSMASRHSGPSSASPMSAQGTSSGQVHARLIAKLGQLEADVYEIKRVNAIEIVKSSLSTMTAISNNCDSMNKRAAQGKVNLGWANDVGNVLSEAVDELSSSTCPAFFRV